MMKPTKTALMFMFSLMQSVWAAKVELVCDDAKVLTVNASGTGFTRISVKGDKLRDVMGLEEDVVVEKNETEGILFLKNITRKQTITLITEGGLIQEIMLLPGSAEAMNIILKPESQRKFVDENKHNTMSELFVDAQPFLHNPSHHTHSPAPSTQEMMIHLIKQLNAGVGEAFKQEASQDTRRPSPAGYTITLMRTFQTEGVIGEVFTVTNTEDQPTHLLEKDFYQKGDVALALLKNQLHIGEQTTLFVIRSL